MNEKDPIPEEIIKSFQETLPKGMTVGSGITKGERRIFVYAASFDQLDKVPSTYGEYSVEKRLFAHSLTEG